MRIRMVRLSVLENERILGIVLVVSALIVIAVSMSLSMMAPMRASDGVPNIILRMEKIVVLEGEEAIERARAHHIGTIRYVQDLAVVHYMPPDMSKLLIVWVALYPNSFLASNECDRMRDAMIRLRGPWAEFLESFSVEGKTVYKSSPNGVDYQYFWVEGRFLYYLIPRNFDEEEIIAVIKSF